MTTINLRHDEYRYDCYRDMTLAELSAMSYAFVNRLDRSPLGRFAVPQKLLLAVDRHERISTLASGGFSVEGITVAQSSDRVQDASRESGVPHSDGVVELMYWWSVSDEPMWAAKSKRALFSWVEKPMAWLGIVADNPEMHPYFAVGLLDYGFVQKCIADGIDVEIAVALATESGVDYV